MNYSTVYRDLTKLKNALKTVYSSKPIFIKLYLQENEETSVSLTNVCCCKNTSKHNNKGKPQITNNIKKSENYKWANACNIMGLFLHESFRK